MVGEPADQVARHPEVARARHAASRPSPRRDGCSSGTRNSAGSRPRTASPTAACRCRRGSTRTVGQISVIAAPENSAKRAYHIDNSTRIAWSALAWPRAPQAPISRAMSSIRPWRDIARRKSRQIMVGSVPVGGDAPVTVQTMTNTPTSDAARDDRPDPPLRGGGRGHHPRVLPRRRTARRRCRRSSARRTCRSSPTSTSTTSARSKPPTPAPPACASIRATSAPRSASRKSSPRRAPTAARSASASMPEASRRTCSKNMASRAPRRWSKARSTISGSSRTMASATIRSR